MKNYTRYNDEQLIALLGEEPPASAEAFKVIYFRYSEGLNSYCLFISQNVQEAEDLHQETWIKFHRIVKSGKRDVKLPGYLYTIARSLNIDKFRLKKNRLIQFSEFFDPETAPDMCDLQNSIDNSDLMNLIVIALNQLSEINREAFVLKWFSGLTCQEIARITDETPDCVKHRCARALDEITKLLRPVIIELKERN